MIYIPILVSKISFGDYFISFMYATQFFGNLFCWTSQPSVQFCQPSRASAFISKQELEHPPARTVPSEIG
jgi:hypothetical protein